MESNVQIMKHYDEWTISNIVNWWPVIRKNYTMKSELTNYLDTIYDILVNSYDYYNRYQLFNQEQIRKQKRKMKERKK